MCFCPVAEVKKDKSQVRSYKRSEHRPFLIALTFAMKTTFVTLWTKQSSVSNA
jgi:hypothetical protein